MSKPKPPKVNEENLRKAKSRLNQITKLKARFEVLEEEREKGIIPETYIALEAIGSIFNALKKGYAYEDLLETYLLPHIELSLDVSPQ